MGPARYVLFWFDVEDCSLPETDDAAKRIALILSGQGVRGTMKIVGQKARLMRERLRYDVIDALGEHSIGYHTDLHGLRPQPAEYMGPLDWLEGGEEFDRREKRGLEELRGLWGRNPSCYGQPGNNWAPQVFPVLRRWKIPVYLSGFGYVGLDSQPFWYGGLLNTSHMYGRDARGRDVRHLVSLGFDMGDPSAAGRRRKLFAASHSALGDGGLISIINHPCQLVMKEWFSTDMKSAGEREAGYRHFKDFVAGVMSAENVQGVTADDLPGLYPDLARGRVFGREELLDCAAFSAKEAGFLRIDGMALSAAEMFGMYARFISRFAIEGEIPAGAECAHLDGPAGLFRASVSSFSAEAGDFLESAQKCSRFLESEGRIPDSVSIGGRPAPPENYLGALSQVASHLIKPVSSK